MRIPSLNALSFNNTRQIANKELKTTTELQNTPQNHATVPLKTWQAYKINFSGEKKQDDTAPVYLFLGPPLAGKGTTAEMLGNMKGIPVISTGAILREHAAKGTEIGKIVKDIMKRGDLVPSDIVMSLVKERISQDDCQNGFIFDGFPRKVNEAQDFLELIKDMEINGKKHPVKVINFVVDKDVLFDRAERRFSEGKREDDKIDAVKHRIEVYHTESEPVKQFFDDLGYLININTESKVGKETSREEVFKKVLD